MANGEQLVRTAYDALLTRVAAGEIMKTDPVEILAGLHEAWRDPSSAAGLAASLLDYARDQANGASLALADRDRVRRRRLYAVAQQIYEQIRLSAAPSAAPA